MRKVSWPLAVVAALVVGGCGDDGLDKADLADRANTICLKYAKRAQDLGQPDLADPDATRTYFADAQDLAQRQLDELETLTPDEAVEADYTRLIDSNMRAAEVFGSLSETSPTDEQGAFAGLVTDLQTLQTEVNEAAAGLDARECGN